MPFGEILRQARQQKQLSLNDVENAIKIRAKYLKALEEEDTASLPGKAYALGFLKTYAKFLNIDEEILLADIKNHYLLEDNQDTAEPVEDTKIHSNNSLKYIIIGIIILIVITLVALLQKSSSETKTVPQNTKKQELQTKAFNNNAANVPINTNKQLNQNSIATKPPILILQATGRSWLHVKVDGEQVFEGIIVKGQQKSYSGTNITIKLGNAGAVKISYNNEDNGYLGNERQVITKTFTLK